MFVKNPLSAQRAASAAAAHDFIGRRRLQADVGLRVRHAKRREHSRAAAHVANNKMLSAAVVSTHAFSDTPSPLRQRRLSTPGTPVPVDTALIMAQPRSQSTVNARYERRARHTRVDGAVRKRHRKPWADRPSGGRTRGCDGAALARAAPPGDRGQTEVPQDPFHRVGVFNQREEPQPPATTGALSGIATCR